MAVLVHEDRHQEQADQQGDTEPLHDPAALSAVSESVKPSDVPGIRCRSTSTRAVAGSLVDRSRTGRYAGGDVMKRLELVRVRLCQRCGRGRAELRCEDGRALTVPLDPARARELSDARPVDDVRPFADLALAELGAAGLVASEVVLDVAHGHLRALVSLVRGGEPEVVACTAQEGVGLAVRGALRLYATDEALAHAAPRPDEHEGPSGPGGSETLH